MKFCALTLLISLSLLSQFTAQIAQASDSPKYIRSELEMVNEKGKHERFHLRRFTNLNGEVQVNVSFIEDRMISLTNTERTFLYGRDEDGDGYPETWYYREHNAVMKVYQIPPETAADITEDPSGVKSVEKIVEHMKFANRLGLGELIWYLTKNFTFSVGSGEQAKDDFFEVQMDYIDLKSRAYRMRQDDPATIQIHALAERMWEKGFEKLKSNTTGIPCIARGVVDIVMIGAGGKILKWAGVKLSATTQVVTTAITATGAYKVVARELAKPVGEFFSRTAGSFSAKLAMQTVAVFEKFGIKTKIEEKTFDAAALSVYSLTFKALRARVSETISDLAAKSRFAKMAIDGLVSAKGVYAAAAKEWDYVLGTQLLQVFAEAYDRYDEIYDPNLLVMANNLFSNSDFIQDVAYMTNDSILQTGVHSGAGSFKRKLLIAGTLSAFDSMTMNLLIKGSTDAVRISSDTIWESIPGNLQTGADNYARAVAKKWADKTNNPKLKLVGWAFVFVDQMGGYLLYNKFTKAAEGHFKNKKSAKAEKTVIETETTIGPSVQGKVSLRLVPVMSDQPLHQ